MKNKRLLLLLFVALSTVYSYAQVTVNGNISDDEGIGLIGVSIFEIADPSNGTITDIDGNFTLSGLSTEAVIRASYVGYSPQDFTLTSDKMQTLNVVMGLDALGLDEIVVTGTANPRSKLKSSLSISTLNASDIAESTPRTTAEIFRTIPGIRSESSGGEGNTNITVRGVPISAGGSKYLQLQEDGLPIFMFGDIAFATSDIFLRADQTIQRIEAIRGGSASTMASNSPAGIINFISKTGEVEGGSIGSTFGLDYKSVRTDFDYGTPLGNGLSFHVGGFFRSGEGIRNAGYTANKGGQIKANLTKKFDNGYARIYVKSLNDRTAAYMPMPIQVSGTNADPVWESVPGFSATLDAPHSVLLQSNFGIGSQGERRTADVADGMNPRSNAIGAEFSFDIGNGWNLKSKTRYARNSGRFIAPFPSAFGTTDAMVETVAGATGLDLEGASLNYAHNGEPFLGDLLQVIHMFDTELNNFDNLMNDISLSKTFNDKITVTGGVFKGNQNINMSWLWNSYLMEVEGDNAGLVDITLADGTAASTSGQFAYGVPVWGNCCQRGYNMTYDIIAPYASVEIEATNALTIDASLRWDYGSANGYGSGPSVGPLDVNNNGSIETVEQNVAVVDHAVKNPIDYDYDYLSYSLGGNYALSNSQAVFARFSQGASAKADRAVDPASALLSLGNPKDVIQQGELGWKSRFKSGGLFVTAFYAATTEEGGFEATTQTVIENDYTAVGLEVEGSYQVSDFGLRGAVTYTKAEITSGDNEGNTPRRQPDLMYSIIPSYSFGNHAVGLSLIGQSSAYAQDGNDLVMPGYMSVNGFISMEVTKGLSLSLNANNLFDTIGITESEEGSITEGQVNYLRARSITGRSLSGTLRYMF